MKPEIYREIMREYDAKQNRALRLYEIRRNEIFRKIPEIRDICRELGSFSGDVATVFGSGESELKTAKLTELKNRTKELISRKSELLTAAGYPSDYMENVYSCPLCKDTGYIEGEVCGCFKAAVREKMYEDSSMKSENDGESFETFRLDFYSDEINPKLGISYRKYMESVLKRCVSFANKPVGNLFFTGNTGLGKSFLCHSIAKKLLDNNKYVVCDTAFSLFDKLVKNRFNTDSEKEYKESIFSCDVLIIDDLGTEATNSITNAELFNIINFRLINKMPTVISANLSLEKVKELYSERIVSRIMGEYSVIPFFGSDIRILKKKIK